MRTALNGSAARLCTSWSQDEEEKQYFEDEENDVDDDDDYWSTDELGIDPEDLYDAAATIQPGSDRQSAEL